MYKPVNVQLVYQCTSMYYYITSCTCVQACQRTISLPMYKHVLLYNELYKPVNYQCTSMYNVYKPVNVQNVQACTYITSCTCVQACQRTISLPMYKHVLLYNELYMCTSLSTYN